jgi:hypothetical protein
MSEVLRNFLASLAYLSGQFWKEFRRRQQRHLSTTIERCSLSHLNLNNCSTPKAPEKGIFSQQNAGPFETYFNWDTPRHTFDFAQLKKQDSTNFGIYRPKTSFCVRK